MNEFNADIWLNEDCNGKPRHQRLCFLVVANGGFEVHGWGITTCGGVHEQGLGQEEALDLMQYYAFMRGLEAAGADVLSAFKPYYDEYVSKLKTDQPTEPEKP